MIHETTMRLALPPQSCKVYTPSSLADAMVASLGDRPLLSWLEPSHGKGAFLEALARINVDRKRIVAVDLDPTPSQADKYATTLRGVDYLRWAAQTAHRFDRIVGNPPYVAISQLPPSLRIAAAGVMDLAGRPIGNGANLWYAFVLASMYLLKQGGCLGFILPAAAEYANYSAAFRAVVRNQFEKLELYRSNRPLFTEVQEGSLVAIARNFQLHPFRIVRRVFASPSKLIYSLSKRRTVSGRPCPENSKSDTGRTVTFSSIANIRLGGVTGDAQYFLMNEQTRLCHKLPLSALTSVVSRARQLRSSYIDTDEWQRLKDEGTRVWLFNPPDELVNHVAVQKYLRRRVGGCNRTAYKVINRTPWYRTPLPSEAHGFLSGMSGFGPWLCVNEMPGLNATNTLYVVIFQNADQKERYRYALSFLTTNVRQQLKHTGRRYCDGLIKYEPSALAGLRLPLLTPNIDFRSLYANALDALFEGNVQRASEIADSAIRQDFTD